MRTRQKINILFLSHDSGPGGAEYSLLELIRSLNKEIFSIYVIIPWYGQLQKEIKKIGIPYYIRHIARWIPYENERSLKHLFNFIKKFKERFYGITGIIERHKIDIVYTNTITCIDGAVASRAMKKPHIWHIREHLSGNCNIKSYLPHQVIKKIIHAYSDQIITNSKSVKNEIKMKNKKRLKWIHNPVDIKKFEKQNSISSIKKGLEISDKSKIIAHIGSLTPVKDVELFINSAEIIRNNVNGVKFLIIGSGSVQYTRHLQMIVRNKQLNEDIVFLGHRDDVNEIIQSIDILIFTSKREAFGRVIVEAMAAEKPVISTRCGGPEEIIINGSNGYIVPNRDPKTIAMMAQMLINNISLAKKIGEEGKKYVQNKFSMKKYIYSIENTILNVVNPDIASKLDKRKESA